MAYAQTLSPQPMHQQYHSVHSAATPMQRRQASKQRFVTELSQCLFDFVIQLLPTQEEMAVKEDVRKLLERLIRTIEPDSRLLSFGSTANGFSLRNSDMDLCCLIDSEERLSATDLVTMLGDLLERETKFHVKPLPHARIPIVKLSLDPSPGLPLGIACDIGFENRLALENTRLLMCYAMIDPTRVRTMVLFRESACWSTRAVLTIPWTFVTNSQSLEQEKGTLSSYGYVLLVIYFLVHVKNPPVLPNLQQMPPLRPISKEDTHLNGHNIWFFDDIDLLRQRWHSENMDTVAELLIDFFRYYSRDFPYNTGVASIRAGLLKKDVKGWQSESSNGRYADSRERNRLCIEDPFETDYNVARCVTKDGLYTIRGEFMRAARILATRPERAIVALAELCEERKDEELVVAPPYNSRPPTLPPQTPYTVGSQTMRPKAAERLSPPTQFFEPGQRQATQPAVLRPPPEHMAPKRGKWTSPPPPEAPPADHSMFESQLGMGLQLATSSTAAREKENASNSSESNSEVFTDDGSDIAEDDIKSVRSYTEGSNNLQTGLSRRPSWHTPDLSKQAPAFNTPSTGLSTRAPSTARGRFSRQSDKPEPSPPTSYRSPDMTSTSPQIDYHRRSLYAPPRSLKVPTLSSNTPLALVTPLPPSPESPMDPRFSDSSNVYYQTTTTRSPRPTALYPSPGTHSSFLAQYHSQQAGFIAHVPQDIFPSNLPPALSSLNPRHSVGQGSAAALDRLSAGPETPTPANFSSLHSHSLSSTTITAITPSPSTTQFPPQVHHNGSPSIPQNTSNTSRSSHSPKMQSPRPSQSSKDNIPRPSPEKSRDDNSSSPQASDANSNGSSPAPSSAGYSTSISRSPSPHSPASPQTAMPFKHMEVNTELHTSFSALTIEAGSKTAASNGLVAGLNSAAERES
ncbi:hypothetical protein CVT26_012153 [Gymnopilus dilepis]|uniref:polynucleotide adenylyltransferase n=1 Tax=Gymnopilus dilepis TaxID=231916 RepID=A0A409W5Q0_9AGAR|nr:hypothetical protein CVT26_012153 [Gymnopilus dilepis]